MAAMPTRFFFRASTAASVSPAFSADWDDTAEAARRLLATTRLSTDTLAGGSAIDWSAGDLALDRQYVSDPLAAGIDFAGMYVSASLRAAESNADDNATWRAGIRLVNAAGTVERAVLLAVGAHSSGTEISSGAYLSRRAIQAAQISASLGYRTQAGDRLVVELGYSDASGTTPDVNAVWGSSGGAGDGGIGDDLPYGEGASASYNPWIEFSGTIITLAQAQAIVAQGVWGPKIWAPVDTAC
jgi:hypothetical protein